MYKCCKNKKFFWKNVLGKKYFRLKNWKMQESQGEQSAHITLWRSMGELLHLVFLLSGGKTTVICFLFRQLCVLCCWSSYGQKQPLQMFCKIGVFKNVGKTCRKTSVLNPHLKEVNLYNIIKNGLQHMCFRVNFEKFIRTHFLKNTFRWPFLCRLYF